jgi:hypothetical protein
VIVAAVLGLPVALVLAWSLISAARSASRGDQHAGHRRARAAALWRIPSLWIALAVGMDS